ncbi:serine/threonine-protein kinase RIO3-like [Trichoplusia ni]|uniref:Serine/threonine-protein kinase RIO3 n=1 Tax=Trichoplusia ni TaxID=7111 RepID=A0A7E5WLA3_TRINI|nr:serine/threonine-protein kinase RIO3-like [Trichoplusia ni]
MSNPWKKVPAPAEVKCLSDIMKEELKFSEQLSNQDVRTSKNIPQELLQESNVKECCDFKVSVPYVNYFNVPQKVIDDSDSEDSEDDVINRSKKDCDQIAAFEKEFGYLPRRGHVSTGGKVITKNVTVLRKQTRKQKMAYYKVSQATADLGIDEESKIILHKLIVSEVLDDIGGIITTGRKSVVLHANGNTNNPDLTVPKECAIKVFKTPKELKIQDKYIEPDYHLDESMQNPRKIVDTWSEKEMHNMIRLKKIGLNCPDIVRLKKNVLVMSFIGINAKPALTLREALLKPEQWQSAYNEVVEAVHKLYNVGHLIHADLSENNILWWDNKCWFIDVSQSVLPDHPKALRSLLRDCCNIAHFFMKKGVPDVMPPVKLFKSITGFNEIDLNFIKFIRTSYNPLTSRFEIAPADNKNVIYPFDHYWKKSSEPKAKSDISAGA